MLGSAHVRPGSEIDADTYHAYACLASDYPLHHVNHSREEIGQGLVLSDEGISAEDVGVGDCVAEGREEGVEAFDILREGADDE